MRRTVGLLGLLAMLGAHAAAAQQPSLIGTWEWTRKKNNCVEQYTFRDNGTASIRSGDDRTETTFALAWAAEPNGRYKLTLKPVTDSGGRGCADTPEEAAARRGTVYVLFGGSRETMILCASLEGADCIGPLRRSVP
jgi:hypothetical protein